MPQNVPRRHLGANLLEFPKTVIEAEVIHKFARQQVDSMRYVETDMVYALVIFLVASGCLTHHKTKWIKSEGWDGYANTWAAVSAPSGLGKSAIYRKVVRPLQELEELKRKAYLQDLRGKLVDLEFAQDERDELRKSAKKVDMTDKLRGEIVDMDSRIEELVHGTKPFPRLITSSTTPAKLVDDCSVTGGQSLCLPEAGPLRRGFDQYGDGGDLDAWLESYDGGLYADSRMVGDRSAFLLTHMLLMPQSGALAKFETDLNLQDAGLPWRFMVVRARQRSKARKIKGKDGPSAELDNEFLNYLRKYLLEAPPHNEYWYSEDAKIAIAEFGDGDAWNARWEIGGDLHTISPYRAKLDGCMWRIGLVLHILNGHGHEKEIGVKTAEKVLLLVEYLAEEKRDVHLKARTDIVETAGLSIMRWLLAKYDDEDGEPTQGLVFDNAGDALFGLVPIMRNDVVTPAMGDSRRASVVQVVEHLLDAGCVEFAEEPDKNWARAKRSPVKLIARYEMLTDPEAPWNGKNM